MRGEGLLPLYEPPAVVDLGKIEDLTQFGVGGLHEHSQGGGASHSRSL